MLDDPDGYASVTVRLRVISDHCSLDRGGPVVAGSLEQLHEDAHRRAKLQATWQPQVKTRGAHVVEQTVETERLVVDVHAPDSGGQCLNCTWLCPPFICRISWF